MPFTGQKQNTSTNSDGHVLISKTHHKHLAKKLRLYYIAAAAAAHFTVEVGKKSKCPKQEKYFSLVIQSRIPPVQ